MAISLREFLSKRGSMERRQIRRFLALASAHLAGQGPRGLPASPATMRATIRWLSDLIETPGEAAGNRGETP